MSVTVIRQEHKRECSPGQARVIQREQIRASLWKQAGVGARREAGDRSGKQARLVTGDLRILSTRGTES